MSFLGKLVGVGVTAAAAVVAAKVAKKYLFSQGTNNSHKEEILVDGVAVHEDTQTGYKADTENVVNNAVQPDDFMNDFDKAAEHVWVDSQEKTNEQVHHANQSTEHLTESLADAGKAIQAAGKAVFVAGSAVASKVAEEAPVVFDKVKNQTEVWFEQMKSAVNTAYTNQQQDSAETTVEWTQSKRDDVNRINDADFPGFE